MTTRTTTMNSMATTGTAQQNKEKQKPRWKWSGNDEPSWNDDNDGITYKKKWYDVHNHDGHDWDNQWG